MQATSPTKQVCDHAPRGLWSALWLGLALVFAAWIGIARGGEAAVTWLTAYLLEMSLSVDNLFIFILIFSLTGIPANLQSRALFLGIVGAIVMRAVLIVLGVELLERFHWTVYPLAALLVYAAVRMLRGEERQPFRHAAMRCVKAGSHASFPSSRACGSRFLVRKAGRWAATPLLVALTVIETTDLVFAVDSIPAVLSVTRDPFLVYTSNIFALLGLRSLYFLLAGVVRKLRFLRVGLALMLMLAAAKLSTAEFFHVPPLASLGAIAAIMTASVVASLLFPAPAPAASCTHLDGLRDVRPAAQGCEECLKSGDQWVHLRLCLQCGHVGCCDSSKNKHATTHFQSTGHPVMQSMEPGEKWKWCYVDRITIQ